YFALTGLLHDVSANYYNCLPTAAANFTGTGAGLNTCGHPNDRVGWAINAGVEVRMDFISPGDHAGMGMRYAQGFSSIGAGQGLNSPSFFGRGTGGSASDPQTAAGDVALGWMTDGVYFGHCATNMSIPVGPFGGEGTPLPANTAVCAADGGQIQLTTSWAI